MLLAAKLLAAAFHSAKENKIKSLGERRALETLTIILRCCLQENSFLDFVFSSG